MKIYRIYFNRLGEAPQVWSIDEGSSESEINVSNIILVNVTGLTVFDPKGDNHNSPKAWFQVKGNLNIENGTAFIGRI